MAHTVMVTGADGFIGSHLTEELVKRGEKVRAFCLYNSFGSLGWIDTLPPEIRSEIDIFMGDVRDPNGVRTAMRGQERVFHLAALIAIPFSYHSPDSYVDTNIKGTLNVLNAARELDTQRVLVTSTSEVYGTAQYVPIDEKHPFQGQSPYSATKIGADRLAESFYRSFDLPVTIVRPFNTYGPRQSGRAIIPTIITQLLAGQTEIKLGSLTPTRDFNYVKDTANGFMTIADCDAAIGQELNIATGIEHSIARLTAEQDDLRAMLSEGLDPEMKALCQEEFSANKKKLEELEQELKILLLPRDPNDDKSVIMEIRGGVGGEESALFAHSLYRMYTMYAESKRWTVTLLNYNETELGGVKEADFEIQGAGAYSRLKFESGVHRVQRVPETESGGRVHTSTATVAVLPEMEQAEVDIRPEDIEMQVYRSSGAGGQHINKTSSAVRLIHKPSGIVVACQEERSQVQNREKCMQMLASKLYQIEQERIESAVTSERRSQVGTGMRNERIRTYNFPQGRVTDHRIGLTLYKIDSIMDGALDELIDALVTADQAEKLQSSGEA